MTYESLRAFALRKGNAVSYWHKQKTLGRLVMVEVDGRVLVDVERSEQLIAETTDPSKNATRERHARAREETRGPAADRMPHPPEPPPPPPPPRQAKPAAQPTSTPQVELDAKSATYMEAKTMREVYEAKTAQLEYEELAGKLIRVDAVRSAWASKITGARDALLQIPTRVAPVLAAESDMASITILLEDELRQAIESIAGAE